MAATMRIDAGPSGKGRRLRQPTSFLAGLTIRKARGWRRCPDEGCRDCDGSLFSQEPLDRINVQTIWALSSAKFYDALTRMANGESGVMAGVWMHGPNATTMHPIGGRQEAWDDVSASFDGVASAADGGRVRLDDQLVVVAGDVAWKAGVERGHITLGGKLVDIDGRVTNVYRRDGGG